MNIGLYFGSFNPIHTGHLIIANIVVETSELDQVWFVVSPQNPLKSSQTLLHENDRYAMVEAALEGSHLLQASVVEFAMDKPSYSIDTLEYLTNKYPEDEFSLIIGRDNLESLPKWKNYDEIIKNYKLYVYPRSIDSAKFELPDIARVYWIDAPILDISATFIRSLIKQNKSIQYLVPDSVANLIKLRKLYL